MNNRLEGCLLRAFFIFTGLVSLMLFITLFFGLLVWPARMLDQQVFPVSAQGAVNLHCVAPKNIPLGQPVEMQCVYTPDQQNPEERDLLVAVPHNTQVYLFPAGSSIPQQQVKLHFTPIGSQVKRVRIEQASSISGLWFASQSVSMQVSGPDNRILMGPVPLTFGLEPTLISVLREVLRTEIGAFTLLASIVTALIALFPAIYTEIQKRDASLQETKRQEALNSLNTMRRDLAELYRPGHSLGAINDAISGAKKRFRGQLHKEDWNNISYLVALAQDKTLYDRERIKAIGNRNPLIWSDPIAGALLYERPEGKREGEKEKLEAVYRDFNYAYCSHPLQEAIIKARTTLGLVLYGDKKWPVEVEEKDWPSYIEGKPNPFPCEFAEEDEHLFCNHQLYWKGQNLINPSDNSPCCVFGETGMGKTAMSLALGKYMLDDIYTLGVRLTNEAEIKELNKKLYQALMFFLRLRLSYCEKLSYDFLLRMAPFLNYYHAEFIKDLEEKRHGLQNHSEHDPANHRHEDETQVERMLRALKEQAGSQIDESNALLTLVDAAHLLEFERIRVVLDFDASPSAESLSEFDRLSKPNYRLPFQIILFLPKAAENTVVLKDRWKSKVLTWSGHDFQAMLDHRLEKALDNFSDKESPSDKPFILDASIAETKGKNRWQDALQGANHCPGAFIRLWNHPQSPGTM